MDVLDKVTEFIKNEFLLKPSDRILIGVSGGADSLCLMDCLHRLGYELLVAHFDHQIRATSQMDRDYVAKLARSYEITFVSEAFQEAEKDEGAKYSEELLRKVRYEFLARVAGALSCGIIAVGHTCDDQIETVLMHFLRGAGPPGLRGMLPSVYLSEFMESENPSELRLVRPLLAVTRAEAREYCRQRGIEPIVDQSNQDMRYFRNRIRHQLLPSLETYNPQIRETILRSSDVFRADSEYLERSGDEAFKQVVDMGEGFASINTFSFRQYPLAIQRRVVRRAISSLRPEIRDLGFETTQSAVNFINDDSFGRRVSIQGWLTLERYQDSVRLLRDENVLTNPEYPQLSTTSVEALPVPGRFLLAGNYLIETNRAEFNEGGYRAFLSTLNSNTIALDLRKDTTCLNIRAPQPGDRIQPYGMRGTKKIADLFIDEHIHRSARARWPLVVRGDHVLWVVGLRIADSGRLTDKSRSAITFELRER